jgi:hypothetical protein
MKENIMKGLRKTQEQIKNQDKSGQRNKGIKSKKGGRGEERKECVKHINK